MTPPRPALDERAVEQLLTGRAGTTDADLHRAVTLVRTLGSGPAPQPTAALAHLLDEGFVPAVAPLRRPAAHRTWAVRAATAFTAAAASLLVAGTAQALPAPLQNGVADLVSALTPFELPRPEPVTPDPAPRPEPVDDATPSATQEPSEAPSPSTAPASPTDDDPRDDDADEDRTAAQRQARERQRAAEDAAEESARAQEEAAEESERAAEDAARAREDAAREAARASEDAAEDAAKDAERAAEAAED